MIAIETQVLVYVHRRDSPFHHAASAAVARLAEAPAAWAIPWPCVHEFIAIVTHPRIYDPPSSWSAAWGQVDSWLESPSLTLLSETARHWHRLAELVRGGCDRPTDPRRPRGRTLPGRRCSRTLERRSGFSRFAALTTKNPIGEA